MSAIRHLLFTFVLFWFGVGSLAASLTKIDVTTADPRPIFPVELREDLHSKSTPKAKLPHLGKTDRQSLISSWRGNSWATRNFLVYQLTAQQDITWSGGGQEYEVKDGRTVLVYVTFPVSLAKLFTHDHRSADPLVPLLSDEAKLTFKLYAPEGFKAPTFLEALLAEDARVHSFKHSKTKLPEEVTDEKSLPSGYTWSDLLKDLAVG